jgi:hypothetical protein
MKWLGERPSPEIWFVGGAFVMVTCAVAGRKDPKHQTAPATPNPNIELKGDHRRAKQEAKWLGLRHIEKFLLLSDDENPVFWESPT